MELLYLGRVQESNSQPLCVVTTTETCMAMKPRTPFVCPSFPTAEIFSGTPSILYYFR